MAPELPPVLSEISLADLRRIDVSLEGDWNARITPVWTRETGFLGFANVTRRHVTHKPSLELYFRDSWVGCHCFRRVGGENVFDEELARAIVGYVEEVLASPAEGGGGCPAVPVSRTSIP
jgi:hypothetical protein